MKKLGKIMSCGILMFTLVGCSGGYVEEGIVDAVIVEKEYIPSRTSTSFTKVGKSLIPITRTIPEKFYLTVEHDGLELTFDSEILYNSLENGESIQVLLVKKFDAEGQLKKKLLKEI